MNLELRMYFIAQSSTQDSALKTQNWQLAAKHG